MNVRKKYIELVKEAVVAGVRKEKACDALDINLRTLQRWESNLKSDGRKRNRFSKSNALSKSERQDVIALACSPEFRDKCPHQIVPILAERGLYTCSESTFYRILRQEGLLKHRSNTKPPERKKPEEFEASGPNQIWTWDVSYLRTCVKGEYYYLYLITDIWDRSIVGWMIQGSESGELAARLFREACMRENILPNSLVVHQDNGAPMTSAEFLSVLNSHEILPSYSRPGVCDDNPFSESLFRTAKYRPAFPGRFDSIESARSWMEQFVDWYHSEHRHSGINFVTPIQRREGKDVKILNIRKETYRAAREKNPERWSGKIRNWNRIETVVLNPKKSRRSGQKAAA